MFTTHYNYKPVKSIEMSAELIAEQTGWMTNKELVERMVLAGERLDDFRHSQLDNYDEDYDDVQSARKAYEEDPVELAEELKSMRFREPKKIDEVNQEAPTTPSEEVKQVELIPNQELKHTDD